MPPTTKKTNTICRAISQRTVQFITPTPNGIHAHPCDLRHQLSPTVSQLLRFEGYIPSSLLLIQTTEEQIHLVVQFLIRMVSWLLAIRTFTLVYGSLGQVPYLLCCDVHRYYTKIRSYF